jgi:Ca2+-dependent lipid-binding protein
LRIKIIEGKGLGGFDSNGKSDPYVKVKQNGKKLGRSETIKSTVNPTWNFILSPF